MNKVLSGPPTSSHLEQGTLFPNPQLRSRLLLTIFHPMSSNSQSWKENRGHVFRLTRPAEWNTQNDITFQYDILEGTRDFAAPPIRPGPIGSRRVQPKSTARALKRVNVSTFKLQASKKISLENSSASLVGALYKCSSRTSEERSLNDSTGDDVCQVTREAMRSCKPQKDMPLQPMRKSPMYLVPIALM